MRWRVSRMRCSAQRIRAFTPVFAGYAERCTADPGPFNMLSLERSRVCSAPPTELGYIRVRSLNRFAEVGYIDFGSALRCARDMGESGIP